MDNNDPEVKQSQHNFELRREHRRQAFEEAVEIVEGIISRVVPGCGLAQTVGILKGIKDELEARAKGEVAASDSHAADVARAVWTYYTYVGTGW